MQAEFRCLTILPLRDVTYELYRNSPPLDTALKQYVFRIEPPAFSDVLQARVKLALDEMLTENRGSDKLSYDLPNGMRVSYSARDQSLYLASMLRSLYAHDRLVRQIITGLAGRDVRRALEIFLDFCKSGHIGEDEIFEIKRNHGNYELPLDIVTRVLLRVNHKYYSGQQSYLKNLVQCDPSDAFPDHFVRISALRWFDAHKKNRGPAGVEGFHRMEDAVSSLTAHGHDALRVVEEIRFLVREKCLLAEHLRHDDIENSDLLKISSSGIVHLQLLANPEYVAACAEDTFLNDEVTYSNIAAEISGEDHYSKQTTAKVVEGILRYLKNSETNQSIPNTTFIDYSDNDYLQRPLIEIEAASESVYTSISRKVFVRNIGFRLKSNEIRKHFENFGLSKFDLSLPAGRQGQANRGYGFLTLCSDTDLRKIIVEAVPSIDGRKLKFSFEPRTENEHNAGDVSIKPTQRIYVGNLPKSFEKQQLRTLLAQSEITLSEVEFIRKKDSNHMFAFVDFATIDEASAAIGTLNGMRIEDRVLKASPARPR